MIIIVCRLFLTTCTFVFLIFFAFCYFFIFLRLVSNYPVIWYPASWKRYTSSSLWSSRTIKCVLLSVSQQETFTPFNIFSSLSSSFLLKKPHFSTYSSSCHLAMLCVYLHVSRSQNSFQFWKREDRLCFHLSNGKSETKMPIFLFLKKGEPFPLIERWEKERKIVFSNS